MSSHHPPSSAEEEKIPIESPSPSPSIKSEKPIPTDTPHLPTLHNQSPNAIATGDIPFGDGVQDGPNVNSNQESIEVDIPLKYRLLAFSMILFFATGSSFLENMKSPLKSTFRTELKITNAQYGAIASATSLVNTVLPIIGGIGMDYWGATYAAIISSIFILIGAIVASISASVNSYGCLVGGMILMGFGSTVIESTQSKLYAHWFRGRSLAFVFALDIAWNRITTIFSKASAVPMSEINGWWGWALWIPTIVCAVNLLMVLGYWGFERNVPRKYRPALGKDAKVVETRGRRKFSWATLTNLPMFFWIMCGTQLFQNSAVSVYTSNLADIQTITRGTSKLAAGYNSSLQGIIPIVLTPATGWFFDKFGYRMVFVSWTAILYIIVFSLIGFTQVHPLCPILISSFALTTNAITFIASIPVLVGDDRLLGTAFGVWKAFQNGNSAVLDVAAGAIQDRTPNGSYDRVLYLIIAIKSIEVILGPVYDYLDGRWLGHSLRLPEKKRLLLRKEAIEKDLDYPGWRIDKRVTRVVGLELVGLIITAWVVYIIYSLGT
ncbi:hypothetical protein I302_109144 [Kwoniella bestiolae CBS 10118]|uniref:Lysosomal dipeptide transporter MFSD1 n=1 Tax=Kwoniella bestiolae CBS 10118 TaxID=1296100 RepID=A0A1B9FV33_9TREE|nr:hypothetical protein I302_08290 [Kwoniella bestiolae CBS 10118]OCF22639.1 hypothetical protein I302_08290 [Kwoniella bestiolae CBS 10118]